jgi:hypothetical protein
MRERWDRPDDEMGDAGRIACAEQRDTGLSPQTEQRMAGIRERHCEAEGE